MKVIRQVYAADYSLAHRQRDVGNQEQRDRIPREDTQERQLQGGTQSQAFRCKRPAYDF